MATVNTPTTVKVASIQASSVFCETTQNQAKFTELVRIAAQKGAKIIVLPECALTGYTSQDLKRNWLVPNREKVLPGKRFNSHDVNVGDGPQFVDGPLVQHFQQLAAELQVYISVPFVEKAVSTQDPTNEFSYMPYYEFQFFNTIVLVSPEGEVVGHYRKTNLWNYVDAAWATPGKDLCVVETEYGRVGLAVCFDCHKVMKEYHEEEDIWTLLYSVAWVSDNHQDTADWFENRLAEVYLQQYGSYNVVLANWSVDVEQDWAGYGHSAIYQEQGNRVIGSDKRLGTEILFAELPVAGQDTTGTTETETLFVELY